MKLLIISLAVTIMAAGCMTAEKDTLQLENVLDYQAAMALKKQQALKAEEQAGMEIETIIKNSLLDTPELALFDLSEKFVRYEGADIALVRNEYGEEKIPPFAEVVWRDLESSMLIVAGKVEWDSNFVVSKTKKEFKQFLQKNVAAQYNKILTRDNGAGAIAEIRDNETIIIFRLSEKYLDQEEWFTDERNFLIYQPGYRLNIFMSQRSDDDYDAYQYFEKSFLRFQADVIERFPQGIDFKAED